jgi:hypothetical protein
VSGDPVLKRRDRAAVGKCQWPGAHSMSSARLSSVPGWVRPSPDAIVAIEDYLLRLFGRTRSPEVLRGHSALACLGGAEGEQTLGPLARRAGLPCGDRRRVGNDVGGRARGGVQVVDRDELRHPLAAVFLPRARAGWPASRMPSRPAWPYPGADDQGASRSPCRRPAGPGPGPGTARAGVRRRTPPRPPRRAGPSPRPAACPSPLRSPARSPPGRRRRTRARLPPRPGGPALPMAGPPAS